MLNNKVTEEAGTAHFVTSYSDGGHLILHSKRRIDGLLLEGLLQDQPKNDLIPKIVRGLLAHRTRGRWGNTQENAWVLLALDKYFHVYEGVTPNFVADVWLGKRYAGGHKFKGRTTERHHIDIPMKTLAEMGKADLVIGKKGKGRVYYRIGMRYAPKDLKLPAESHGFAVSRRYEAVDDPADVKQDKDGTWRIKAGARVRVHVTMHNKARRYHVALVDPLPAGLEPLNAALRGTDTTPDKKVNAPSKRVRRGRSGRSGRRSYRRSHYYRHWGSWFRHQNLRDERAEAFTSYLWAGVHEYSYTARATTPGTFVVPSAKAEEMYHPEVFGRSKGDRVVVAE